VNKKILDIVSNRGIQGIAIAQICRTINERGLSYCTTKDCYANSRKRKKQFVPSSVCKYSRTLIFNRIMKMENEDPPRLNTKKERRSDSRQPRGWDWMRGVYLPEWFPVAEYTQEIL